MGKATRSAATLLRCYAATLLRREGENKKENMNFNIRYSTIKQVKIFFLIVLNNPLYILIPDPID
jgi:hypothetical protein